MWSFAKLFGRRPLNQQPAVIIVLGARSGTSALAGALGLLGCTLPQNLMAASQCNAKGHFEPQDLADLHDVILASVGSSWNDWHEFPQSWFKSADATQARSRLTDAYLANYGQTPLSVLKEPRICRLLPLWLEVFESLNLRPAFCFIDRSPVEVAMSLKLRDGSSMEQGLRYYIRNHLDAERDSRGHDRVVISYDELLTDWQSATGKIAKSLKVPLSFSLQHHAS